MPKIKGNFQRNQCLAKCAQIVDLDLKRRGQQTMSYMDLMVNLFGLTPLSAQISASNFHDLTQITARPFKAHGSFPNRTENLKSHSAAPRVISNFSVRFGKFSVRFEPYLKSHLSAE